MQHSMLISSPFKNASFDQVHQKTIGDQQNFARSSVRRLFLHFPVGNVFSRNFYAHIGFL
jgi:hypothetical protein